MLTRQGWLVGVGAVALLAAGRILGLPELFALGIIAAALLVGSALLVGTARLELEVGPVDPPRPRPRRHRQPRRPHDPQPARHHHARAAVARPGVGHPRRRPARAAARPRPSAPSPPTGCPPTGAASCRSDRSTWWWATRSASPASPRSPRPRWRSPCTRRVDQIDPLPVHHGPRPARRRAPAELARPHRRGLLRAAALRRGRRPPPHPLAHLRAPRRAPRPAERAARGRAAPPCCSTSARPPTPATRSRSRCRRRRASWRPPRAATTWSAWSPRAGADSDFAPGSDHIEAIMEHLAIVPAAPTGSLRRSVEMLGRHSTGGALVVIVAEVPDRRPSRHAPPAQPVRLGHDRAHRPLGVGSGRADRTAAWRSRPSASRATTPFASAWNTPRPPQHAPGARCRSERRASA